MSVMGRNMFGGHPGPWHPKTPWNGAAERGRRGENYLLGGQERGIAGKDERDPLVQELEQLNRDYVWARRDGRWLCVAAHVTRS